MQSDESPFRSSHAASNGLKLPFDFEYDPFSSENYYHQASYPVTPQSEGLDEPDAFYHSFAERSSQPDIIVQNREDDMATPRKRRQTTATGSASRAPASSTNTSPARPSSRSVSGPVGQRQTLSAAKSTPSFGHAVNGRNNLIKDRVKQYDTSGNAVSGAARTGQARTPNAPNASNTSPGTARLLQKPRVPKTQSPSSTRTHAVPGIRRPLFGEVVDVEASPDTVGYGIPGSFPEDEVEFVGSMHEPNAMFSRSRSQSDLERSLSELPTFDHHRSQSHDSGLPSDPSSVATSPTNDPSSPPFSNSNTVSRIPVRTRRSSDISSSRIPTKPRTRPAQSAQKPATSNSPMLLTSRRYSPPGRRPEPSSSLTAIVRPPLPKTSPPLRSTRNRQPVTAATAASRAKVSERFKPVVESALPNNRSKPAIPIHVDIAERRARLQKNLQGAAHARPLHQDLKNLQAGKYRSHRSNWVDTDNSSDVADPIVPRKPSSSMQTVPILSVKTMLPGPEPQPNRDSAVTDFEESPTLGCESSPNSELQDVRYQRDAPNAQAAMSTSPELSQNLLHAVLAMREKDASDTSPRTAAPDDYLTQIDDGETIQILLGATPTLPAQNWTPDGDHFTSSPDAFHTPREGSGSDFDILDDRSSIAPDDSVSMIYQRRYADMLPREPVPPVPAQFLNMAKGQKFTITSDARSEINRVFEHYQDGNMTPEQAHGFQKQIGSHQWNDPDQCDVPEATSHYPRDSSEPPASNELLAKSSPLQAVAKNQSPYDDESEAGSGGIAIIYGPPSLDGIEVSLERTGTLHSHSTSNATLRPDDHDLDKEDHHKSYLEGIAFAPPPPPKDFAPHPGTDASRLMSVPSLPAIDSSASGLGLSLSRPDSATLSPPRSPHPPIPAHAPPAPPTPAREGAAAPYVPMHAAASPTAERRPPFDIMMPGLPSSPAVSRGRPIQPKVAELPQKDASRSAGPSIDMSTASASRSHSPSSLVQTPAERSSQSLTSLDVEKDLNQRRHRLKELVDTEHTFHQDLTIMTDIYLATATDVLSDEDRRIIFVNIEQLRAFTTDFLDDLKRAAAPVYTIPRENRWNYKRGSFGTSNSEATENSTSTSATIEERLENDKRTFIGQVFVENYLQLQKVYTEWLRGAAAANKRLVELQKIPAVKYWLDECIESHKDLTSAWNLDSLIVKPFQRSAKYSLLLDEILRFTHPDHPDSLALKQAKDLVKAYNERANEAQRRAEVLTQTMGKKDYNNKKTMAKRLGLKTEKFKQQVGLTTQAEDPDYDAIAQKFGGHFFQLQVVMRDVEKYLEDVHKYVDNYVLFMEALVGNISVEAATRYPESESRWINYSRAVMEMKMYALGEHVKQVKKHVIEPVQHLWRLHVGPQRMMAKRKKRLIEFVRYKNMMEKGEKPDKRLETDVEQFQAVNDTLKEELPKLYALTKKLVDTCLLNFIDLQAQWQSTWHRKLGPLIDQVEPLLAMEIPQAMFSVQSDYNQEIAEIDEQIMSFKVCNKALVTEARNLKSPATNYSRDDDGSHKRPSTLGSSGGNRAMSLNSDQISGHITPNYRNSGENLALSPLIGSLNLPPDAIYQSSTGNGRHRAGSAISSRGPSTPYSQRNYSNGYIAGQSSYAISPGLPRVSLESPIRHDFGQSPVLPDSCLPTSGQTAEERYSGRFNSAMPMSESSPAATPFAMSAMPQFSRSESHAEVVQNADGEYQVMFLAASLFEFHIDATRQEGGYPYLTYQPGEIFDVVGQKGELWLARNQDDPTRSTGWIWEKHFARILPDQ